MLASNVGPLNNDSTSPKSVINSGQKTIQAKLNSSYGLVSGPSVKWFVGSPAGNSRECCFACLSQCLRLSFSVAFVFDPPSSWISTRVGRYGRFSTQPLSMPCARVVMVTSEHPSDSARYLAPHPVTTDAMLLSGDEFNHVLESNVCPLNTDGTSIKAPIVSCAALSNCLEIVSLSCTKQL